MPSSSGQCRCPPLEVRAWYRDDPGQTTSHRLASDFSSPSPLAAREGVSVVFAKADAVRKCLQCRHVFSTTFAVPQVWWEPFCRNANGYFGYQDIPSSDEEGHGGAISWCRFKAKHTRLVESPCRRAEYHWPKLNVFSRWHQATSHTTVVVFDADRMGERAANRLLSDIDPQQLHDPFWIYPHLVQEMVRVHDEAVWKIRDVVRETEKNRVSRDSPGVPDPDYPTLHEVARHATHVSETLVVASTTVESIQRHHERFLAGQPQPAVASANIANRLRFFHHLLASFLQRSESNKARLMSEISLAFNTVVQHDSRTSVRIADAMRLDSAAMRTVAFVTLLFLPATFVCAIFSTSFFNFNAESGVWAVSDKFWIYWTVSVPLTVVSVLVWLFWIQLVTGVSMSATGPPAYNARGMQSLRSVKVSQ